MYFPETGQYYCFFVPILRLVTTFLTLILFPIVRVDDHEWAGFSPHSKHVWI